MTQKRETCTRLGNGQVVVASERKNGTTNVLVGSHTNFVRKIYKNGSAKTDREFALCASSVALAGGVLVFAREKQITTKGDSKWT